MPLNPLQAAAKMLWLTAGLLAILGLVLWAISKMGSGGRLLPGDIVIQRPGITFYLPLATCLLISVILSAILVLVGVLRR